MKTKEKKIKEFDTVKVFRDIKTEISKEITGMSFDQLAAYLNTSKLKSGK